MAAEKEAVILSRVHMFESKCDRGLRQSKYQKNDLKSLQVQLELSTDPDLKIYRGGIFIRSTMAYASM